MVQRLLPIRVAKVQEADLADRYKNVSFEVTEIFKVFEFFEPAEKYNLLA